MEIIPLLTQGFILGVALSPTCLGVCLPLLVPFFGAERRPTKENWKAFGFFLSGRLGGYVVMGMLAGWIGQEFLLNEQTARTLEASVFLLMGLVLVAYAIMKSFPHWSFCSFLNNTLIRKRTPWLMGLLTGINICPPFVAALFDAARAGGPIAGGIVLVAFFVGTSLILIPLPIIGFLAKEEAMQVAGRVAAGIIGLWFVMKGSLLFL
jgi:sulfite exporter TauE/SafE